MFSKTLLVILTPAYVDLLKVVLVFVCLFLFSDEKNSHS